MDLTLCFYIVPIAAGFQRGILETSAEEARMKKKENHSAQKINEKSCNCTNILQHVVFLIRLEDKLYTAYKTHKAEVKTNAEVL